MPRILSIEPVSESALPAEKATAIFDQIALFAGYGFNKSHAAAYAAISFQTAWLRTHHPQAFFAAAMNLALDKVDEIAIFATELQRRGILLEPPSINLSDAVFRPCGDSILYGLAAIRGVGKGLAEMLVAEREANGPFAGLGDLRARMSGQITKTALLALARAGAFDEENPDRNAVLADVQAGDGAAASGQMSMFDMMGAAAPDIPRLDPDGLLDFEFDVLGHFMSTHPLAARRTQMRARQIGFASEILTGEAVERMAGSGGSSLRIAAIVADTDLRKTRAGNTLAVLTLSDPGGQSEAVVFGETWEKIRSVVRKKARLLLLCSLSERGGGARLVVENAWPLPDAADARHAA